MKWSGRLTSAKVPSARRRGAATNFCTRHPCSSRRNLPKPKPPPVAAGCGARGRHTVHTGQAPLGAAYLQQPAEKIFKFRAGATSSGYAAPMGLGIFLVLIA